MPLLILHNNLIYHVGNLIELARIRRDWEAFKAPSTAGVAATLPPTDDSQFLGELAAPAYIPGPLDMPFRLVDVPDDPKLTPTALKAKLWGFYQKETAFEIFGDEAHDPNSEVFQIHLQYLSIIRKFKLLYNHRVVPFWNAQAHQFWKDVEAYIQQEAPQRKLLGGEANALLKGYRHRLTQSYTPIAKELADLEQKKAQLSALVQAHPKLKKTGVRITFGLRAAIIRPPGLFDVFEEYQKHQKKVDDSLVMLAKEHQEILIIPILQSLIPPFATKAEWLEPID